MFGRQGSAADQRRSAADNAIGAHHPLVEIGDVHRAALAFAGTADLAEDLGHHAVDRDTLGDAVAMAAMS